MGSRAANAAALATRRGWRARFSARKCETLLDMGQGPTSTGDAEEGKAKDDYGKDIGGVHRKLKLHACKA